MNCAGGSVSRLAWHSIGGPLQMSVRPLRLGVSKPWGSLSGRGHSSWENAQPHVRVKTVHTRGQAPKPWSERLPVGSVCVGR